MKNYGILKFRYADIDNFTSEFGMNFRKKINPLFRNLLKIINPEEIIIDNYPILNKEEAYIFVSLHNFVNDSVANLATIDRNAYLLFGTTDQLETNKITYAAWLNGFIYVNREDKKSRSDSLLKMERILNNGNSVLIFPEGGFNNTENLLCQKLFSSPYLLAKSTGKKVVPIAPLYEFGSDKIYMNVGEPIDLAKYDNKEDALTYLRDVLSTLLYENLEKNSTMLVRKELTGDIRQSFMELRKEEYMKTAWSKDVWDEELVQYLDDFDKEYIEVQESMDKINITKDNANIMGPILVKRMEEKKYNFKDYMHKNWNK